MAVQMKAYTPTASQWASATVHLERRDEWQYFWSKGVRYVSIISGRSNRLYVARADAAGCSCAWSLTPWSSGTPCSHRIALELDALEEDLRDALAAWVTDLDQDRTAGLAGEGEVEMAFAEVATRLRGNGAGVALIRTYDELWPAGED